MKGGMTRFDLISRRSASLPDWIEAEPLSLRRRGLLLWGRSEVLPNETEPFVRKCQLMGWTGRAYRGTK
jgi:hypothetical protein